MISTLLGRSDCFKSSLNATSNINLNVATKSVFISQFALRSCRNLSVTLPVSFCNVGLALNVMKWSLNIPLVLSLK